MILLLASLAVAGPIEDGAARWSTGDMPGAIEIWEQALTQGRGSATLHRNLGVAWYRAGDAPRAVAHLRMARLLDPRDPDAAHDLAVLRAELATPAPVDPVAPWLGLATVGEYGVVGLVFFAVASAGAWWARWRTQRVWPWLVVALPALLATAASIEGARRLHVRPAAVVLVSDARLRPEPDPAAPLEQRIMAGSEVAIARSAGEFVLVEADGGHRGWLPSGSVARIGVNFSAPTR
jgi:hypothetical protein